LGSDENRAFTRPLAPLALKLQRPSTLVWKPLGETAPKGGASRDPARRARGTRLLLMPLTGFIPDTLMAYPRPCAARLFDMIVKRGYPGARSARLASTKLWISQRYPIRSQPPFGPHFRSR
jgi:hypothetical protein